MSTFDMEKPNQDKDMVMSLEDAIRLLPALFTKQKAEFDMRDRMLREAEIELEVERSKVFENTSPSDVLELNVGGTPVTALRRTLCQVEDSMLATRFSGRWDDSLEKDSQGRFFIDQPPRLFLPLLDHLRAFSNQVANAPDLMPPDFPNRKEKTDFLRMVEYYGCSVVLDPPKLVLVRGDVSHCQISQYPHYSTNARAWCVFGILKDRSYDNRKIVAYEIEVSSIKRAYVGWAQSTKNYFIQLTEHGSESNIWSASPPPERSAYGRPTGESGPALCVALDCTTHQVVGGGRRYSVISKAPPLREGSIIRCELEGFRWWIDGTLVASSSDPEFAKLRLEVASLSPTFGCEGDWRVTKIELSRPSL